MSARQGAGRRQAGMVLALVMLALRLAVATYPVPAFAQPTGAQPTGAQPAGAATAQVAGLFGELPICHAEPDAPPTSGAPGSDDPPVPAHDCMLCPVCQLASAPMLMPVGARAVAAPPARRATIVALPPATGPPSPERYAARPRGPPLSV